MVALVLKTFAGMRPLVDPRLLNTSESVLAENARLQSGALTPFKANLNLSASVSVGRATSTIKALYPVLNNTKWMSWTTEADVVESPIIDDQWDRIYWTDGSTPKYGPKTYVTSGSAPFPSQYYTLGVPKPASTPVASGAAIADVATQVRAYAVTYYNPTTSTESRIGTTSQTTCISSNYDFGLYDVALTVSGTTVTAVFSSDHDFAVADYVKITAIATAFAVATVVDVKTITFDRGVVAVSSGSTTASKRVRALTKLTALPTSGNSQSGVTQKRIYRKVSDTYRLLTTLALTATSFDDALVDADVSGGTIAAKVLNEPRKPTFGPTASYEIDDESIATNAALASPAATAQRVYAVSWLHDSGYESPTSASSGFITSVDGSTSVKITHAETAPAGCSKKRIYRQNVTTSGAGTFTITEADFRLLVEIPSSQISYSDKLSQATISARAAPTNQGGLTEPTDFFATSGAVQPNRVPETRVYVYTYVSTYGEEGPPSEPSEAVDIDPEYSVTLSSISGAPNGSYNIQKIFIYRTATASSGATDYQFVKEIAIGVTSTTDSVRQAALGELIPSIGWIAPPADMRGLKMMANGIAIGWSGDKTICFSEPFQPHAYPAKYRITTDSPIVGIGVFGQSAVILTKAYPYLVSGVSPESMTMSKLPIEQSCVSKRSIVDTGGGILYASPDGLVLISSAGVRLATESVLSQEQWQEYSPSSIHAYYHENRYHGYYNYGGTVRAFIFDPSGATATWCEVASVAYAGHRVVQDDALYVAGASVIEALFGGSTTLSYTWKSRIASPASPINLSFGQVVASAYPVTLRVYADGTTYSYTVADSNPFRLQSGFLAKEWQCQVEGTANVTMVALAQSSWELKSL